MNKKERLLALVDYFASGNKTLFANIIGISPQGLSTWLSRDTYDIERIYSKCENISPHWLLTGEGNMLKSDRTGMPTEVERPVLEKGQNNIQTTIPQEVTRKQEAIPLAEIAEDTRVTPIPLVTETAVAGFGNNYFSIDEKDVKEYYVIPKFRFCRVDFMIEVSGLSMYPHFNPGDVIACTILRDRRFLQWNKCHVIATREQGILVKRIMPGKNDEYLTAVSDNKDYPPFDIPVEDITGLALVVGSVSLE